MGENPALIYTDAPGTLPARYVFGPGLSARLSSVSAVFNGAGAGGDFLACLSVYSQDGKLIGRFFPGSAVTAGDVAEVTFAPFLAADDASGGEGIQFHNPVHYGQDYNLGESLDIETTGDWDLFAGDVDGVGHVIWTVKSFFNVDAYSGVELKANGDNSGIVLKVDDAGDLALDTVGGGDINLNPGAARIRLLFLPVSPVGLPAGSLWNNAGVVNIV